MDIDCKKCDHQCSTCSGSSSNCLVCANQPGDNRNNQAPLCQCNPGYLNNMTFVTCIKGNNPVPDRSAKFLYNK